MTAERVHDAAAFVSSIDLTGVPTHAKHRLAPAPPAPPAFVPDTASDQAVVVGGTVQSFATGVPEPARDALGQAMLLAQLAAKKDADGDDPERWYDAYFAALTGMGLLVEQQARTTFDSSTVAADVHRSVLELAAGLLGGPATTAYVAVAKALEALATLDEGSPAVTIFRRETLQGPHRRFQVSSAQAGEDGRLRVGLMAFVLETSKRVTQVLFFKAQLDEARLRHASSTLSVDPGALARIAEPVAAKVGAYVDGHVRQLRL